MPAAAGVAMLVPELVRVTQLLVLLSLSLLAETILTPGMVISGLMRASSVGPQDEKLAIRLALAARWVAPTDSALLAVDGLLTVPAFGPELPAANRIRKSLCSHMNSS